MHIYKLDEMKDENGNLVEVPLDIAVQIVNIRYTMRFTSFRKYEATTVAENISEETMADILEHTADLPGVNIEESTIRVYNDAIYFAPVIGYTGKVTTDGLEELKKQSDDYELNDVAGRTGIESSMELDLIRNEGVSDYLRGQYGKNSGIQPTWWSQKPETTSGFRWIGILEGHLPHFGKAAGRYSDQRARQPGSRRRLRMWTASEIKLPIKDAYFQLINNNVLSFHDFASEEASDTERQINAKFESARARIEADLKNELTSSAPAPMNALSEDMQAYMQYIYTLLASDSEKLILSF